MILASFYKEFPEYLDDAKLKKVSEEEIKSPEGKKRWRNFMMPFEKVVTDYNFGTLIRLDCEGEYDEHNSMFGKPSTQSPPCEGTPPASTPCRTRSSAPRRTLVTCLCSVGPVADLVFYCSDHLQVTACSSSRSRLPGTVGA